MGTTVWECGACGRINHMSSKVCEGCGLPRYSDVSKTFEAIESAMNTLEITEITTDHIGSAPAIVTTDTVIEEHTYSASGPRK